MSCQMCSTRIADVCQNERYHSNDIYHLSQRTRSRVRELVSQRTKEPDSQRAREPESQRAREPQSQRAR